MTQILQQAVQQQSVMPSHSLSTKAKYHFAQGHKNTIHSVESYQCYDALLHKSASHLNSADNRYTEKKNVLRKLTCFSLRMAKTLTVILPPDNFMNYPPNRTSWFI